MPSIKRARPQPCSHSANVADTDAVILCACGERLYSETQVRALVATLVDAELARRTSAAWRRDECSYIS